MTKLEALLIFDHFRTSMERYATRISCQKAGYDTWIADFPGGKMSIWWDGKKINFELETQKTDLEYWIASDYDKAKNFITQFTMDFQEP
jgi:hypothetical protein